VLELAKKKNLASRIFHAILRFALWFRFVNVHTELLVKIEARVLPALLSAHPYGRSLCALPKAR
ncbi:MAG: hypothetical protein ACREOH_00240, partial [Candidatus Entotheonellia bacterium]